MQLHLHMEKSTWNLLLIPGCLWPFSSALGKNSWEKLNKKTCIYCWYCWILVVSDFFRKKQLGKTEQKINMNLLLIMVCIQWFSWGSYMLMVVELVPLKGGRDYITPPERKDYKWYISGIFPANWGIICYLPPFRGTRNNHWICSGSWKPFNFQTTVEVLSS